MSKFTDSHVPYLYGQLFIIFISSKPKRKETNTNNHSNNSNGATTLPTNLTNHHHIILHPSTHNMFSSSGNTNHVPDEGSFSFFMIIASSVFWVWAIYNTLENKSFDLGIISFLSVLITHSILLINRYRRGHDGSSSSKCASYSIVGTHLFVTFNYLVGLYAALATDLIQPPERQSGFATYCGVAAFFWFISAVAGYFIYTKTNRTKPDQATPEVQYNDDV